MQLNNFGMGDMNVIFPVSVFADNPKNSLNNFHAVL